ncbi:hypothetical protein ACUXAV_006194 [Cupriavidus metallidurans]|nr:hypothetical protein Cmtc_57780 [Cupriavidus sp. TKC]
MKRTTAVLFALTVPYTDGAKAVDYDVYSAGAKIEHRVGQGVA